MTPQLVYFIRSKSGGKLMYQLNNDRLFRAAILDDGAFVVNQEDMPHNVVLSAGAARELEGMFADWRDNCAVLEGVKA